MEPGGVGARPHAPIPGPKTVLLLGWGLGHLTPTGAVVEDADYQPARRALARAHATVFVLDVTDADSHSLEVGLQQVADDTGGTYSKTHEFPGLALDLLERALVGHYVLTFARPDLPDGNAAWTCSTVTLKPRRARPRAEKFRASAFSACSTCCRNASASASLREATPALESPGPVARKSESRVRA